MFHRKAWKGATFGSLGVRQPNILVICPSVVATGVALGSPFLLLIGSGTLEAAGQRRQSQDLSILGTLHGFCRLISNLQ